MSIAYYILGYIAKLNDGMWRYRLNFIPSNLIVVGIIAVFGLNAATDTFEGLSNGAIPLSSTLLAVFLLGIVVFFVVATFARNTVFQRANFGSPLSKMRSAEPLHISATGTFTLDQSGKLTDRRFIEMPAVLMRDENGNPVILSKIDASSRFMGITTTQRSGIWSMAPEPGSVGDPQVGFLYWGTTRRVALRFTYTQMARADKRQAFLSASDVQTLDAAVGLLTAAPAAEAARSAQHVQDQARS